MCFQELFYGPYFCQVQEHRVLRVHRAHPRRPHHPALPGARQGARHGDGAADVRDRAAGHVLQHRGGRSTPMARYLGKYRKQHIPQTKGFWEKFYFTPGTGGYPVFDTAVGKVGVYICYDRHFPEGWRALGLNGAEIVFNPSATHRGLSEYLWRLEQPASAVANIYYVGAINRVGIEPLGDERLLRPELLRRSRGQVRRRASATPYKPELIVRDLDMDKIKQVRDRWAFYRDRRPDAYDELVVLDRELIRRPHRRGRGTHMAQDAHQERQGHLAPPGVIAQDVLIDGETITRARRARVLHRRGHGHASSTRPASTSSPVASTCTRTWSCPSAAPSPATRSRPARAPRRGVASPPSSTWPCSATARTCSTAWPSGTARPTATAPSTTPSTRSSAASTTSR